MLGKPPHHVSKANWCASGLGIMLAQVTHNVHIYINKIKAYSNMNKWGWRGNLHFTIKKRECRCSVIQAKQITCTNIFNKTTLPSRDTTKISLKASGGSQRCTCLKLVEEKYVVHILESYFLGVGMWVHRSKNYDWHINVLRTQQCTSLAWNILKWRI